MYGFGILDIPKGYENSMKYNGTLAHKMNHDFDNNVRISNVSSNDCNNCTCCAFKKSFPYVSCME